MVVRPWYFILPNCLSRQESVECGSFRLVCEESEADRLPRLVHDQVNFDGLDSLLVLFGYVCSAISRELRISS